MLLVFNKKKMVKKQNQNDREIVEDNTDKQERKKHRKLETNWYKLKVL